MSIKLILFDFFGTLAFFSKKPDSLTFLKLLEKFDIDFNNFNKWSKFVPFYNYSFSRAKNWKDGLSLIFRKFKKRPKKEAIRKVSQFLDKNLVFKFYDDVKIIEKIPFRKSILTTAPRFMLEKLSLDGFEKILTPREVRALKPDKKAFLNALKILKVLPNQALMIGDDLERDIIPAKKLGMEAILIDRDDLIKNRSIRKIKSLKELKKILGP
ncbi:HAD family hydrolase [Patescibacteria group bacterium]|nr:HAD family hydrolase [Patescibacteria group bacterium]